ncbi:MAG: hypothetical protein R3C14_24845 [Caldilineaceae bacterium]
MFANDRAEANSIALDDLPAWALEAYLDGEPAPDLAEVLTQNPTLQRELEEQEEFAATLQSMLYRFDCPSPQQLRAYHWQELNTAATDQVRAHLALCTHCSTELAALAEFVPAPKASPLSHLPKLALNELRERVDEALAKLQIVVATLVTPLTPATSGVALRSEAATSGAQSAPPAVLLFEAENADLSVMVQPAKDDTRHLAGQLLATAPIEPKVVRLVPADEQLPTVTADLEPTGAFTFEQVQPGHYQLMVHAAEQTILIPDLIIA